MHYRETAEVDRAGRGEASPPVSRLIEPTSHHRPHQLSNNLYIVIDKSFAADANAVSRLRRGNSSGRETSQTFTSLYTPEERRRRDATRWTMVQGILAPVQFVMFLVSLALVVRYLSTGEGAALAAASIVIKTLALYAIMITGAIWEKEVFGCYLFAPAFFWEDVFSFLVLALHTAYLVALLLGFGDPRQQMWIALAAYAAYVINATQFVLKLRAAKRDERVARETSVSRLAGGSA